MASPTPSPFAAATPAVADASTRQAASVQPEWVGLAAAPVAVSIDAIHLQAPVKPMQWEIVMLDNQRTTQWVVPADAAGWDVTSADAGRAGNLILAGFQSKGAAVFGPLVHGLVQVGQEVDVQRADGATVRYRIKEVSPPLPVIGFTPAEQAQAEAYLAPTRKPQLTLVTGWPADIGTHRLFVVAELIGGAP